MGISIVATVHHLNRALLHEPSVPSANTTQQETRLLANPNFNPGTLPARQTSPFNVPEYVFRGVC